MNLKSEDLTVHFVFLVAWAMSIFATEMPPFEPLRAFGDVVDASAQLYVPPPNRHHPGVQHLVLYRHEVNGETRLLKITPVLGSDHRDDLEVMRQIEGQALAVAYGGPHLYRAGRLRQDVGQIAYFLDMEFLFPDVVDTVTLKGVIYHRGAPAAPRLTNAQVRTLARRLTIVLENRIWIGDADAIFHPSGDMRWIDTTAWRPEPDIPFDDLLSSYAVVVEWLFESEAATGRYLARELVREIEATPGFEKSVSTSLIHALKSGLGHLDAWVAKPGCGGWLIGKS